MSSGNVTVSGMPQISAGPRNVSRPAGQTSAVDGAPARPERRDDAPADPELDAEVAHAHADVDRFGHADRVGERQQHRVVIRQVMLGAAVSLEIGERRPGPDRTSASRVTGMPWFATITTAFNTSPTKIRMNPGGAG